MICKLNNLHAFTSFAWGVKNVKRLLQNRQRKAADEKDAYLQYRQSRPFHEEANLLLATAVALAVLALLCALPLM